VNTIGGSRRMRGSGRQGATPGIDRRSAGVVHIDGRQSGRQSRMLGLVSDL
jgi:hypothetical protein